MAVLLITILLESFLLFLGRLDKPRKSRRPELLRAAALILFGTIIIFALVNDVKAPAPTVGRVNVGDSCYFEVSGVAMLNQSPCTAQPNQFFYSNLSNNFAITESLSISFQTDQLRLISFDIWKNVTRFLNNFTTVNITEKNWGNGTLENFSNTTLSLYPKNFTEWVSLPRLSFSYDGRSWEGATTTIPSKATAQYRIKLAPKQYGGIIEYSILANSSGFYTELDPPLNATASNITSDSDLNLTGCQPDCAKFVSGKLLLGAGNRTNITIYESFSSFTDLMTRWTPYNTSSSQTLFDPAGYNLAIIEGVLNVSVNGGDGQVKLVGADNLSVPEVAGMVLSGYLRYNRRDGVGGYGHASFCFVQNWDTLANSTTSTGCQNDDAGLPNIGGGSFSEGLGNNFNYIIGNTATSFGTGKRSTDSNSYTHFNLWFNWTHMQMTMNQTEGGLVDSGLITLGANPKVSSGGKLVLSINSGSGTTPNAVSFENVTLANASQFGQPFNFTAARLQSNVLNSTIVATSVKVTNQTSNQSATGMSLFVFDGSHKNLQSISEGDNTITSITGVGINATVSPTRLYTVTELTSIQADWNEPVPVSAIPTMQNNGTNTTIIRKGTVIAHSANFSTTGTLTFVVLEHNMTSAGTKTNITIPASGTNFNATANITILFGNQTNYAFKWYANTSTEINNTILSASYTTSNTAPFGIPAINIPPNQSVFNISSVTFNATNISDVDNNTITPYWYLNDVFNTTGTAVDGNQRGNVTITGLNSGNYTMRVQAYDGTTFSSNSTTTNFTIDTIAPAIVLNSPSPADNSFLPFSSINITTTSNDAGNDHNELSAFVDFNRSLVGYWRFEDDGDNTASDFSTYNNSGTLVGFGCTIADCNLTGGAEGVASGFVSNGKRGKAIAFDGKDDRINVSYSPSLNITSAITIAAWIKPTTLDHLTYVEILRRNSVYILSFQKEGTQQLTLGVTTNTGATETDTVITPSDYLNRWSFIVGSWNGTHANLYKDGVLIDSDLRDGTSLAITVTDVFIGSNSGTGEFFNGSIDEVQIWNRILSAQEVNASYQAGVYRLFRNFTGLNDGNYSYRAHVVDLAGNINSTASRNFTVDTIFPTVNFSIGTNANNSFLAVPRIKVNISSTELNPDRLNITLYNGTNLAASFNTSYNATPNWNNFNFTGLADGKYNISAVLTDKAGNRNSTPFNRTVTIDTTPPNIDNGSGMTTYIRTNSVIINYSWTETNNDTFFIRNGTTTSTPTNTTPNASTTYFTFNFTGLNEALRDSGNYTFTGWVNDTVGNVNTTNNFTIVPDYTLPIVENGTVSPASAVAGNPFTITVDYFDLWLGGVNATIAGTNYTMTCTATACTFTFTNTSTQGNYVTDRFYAQDQAGNIVMNITSLTFTATAPATGAGTSGGGGGGGALVVVEKDTGTTIIINGTLTATPPEINAYANYFPTGPVYQKTWQKTVRTNSILDRCLFASEKPDFTCAINPQDKTSVTISTTYTQTGFAKTLSGQITLLNSAENAVRVPIRITSFNTGASLPFTFSVSDGLEFLTPSLLFNHPTPGKAQLRWLSLAVLTFLPTFYPAIKGLSRAARFKGNGRMRSPTRA